MFPSSGSKLKRSKKPARSSWQAELSSRREVAVYCYSVVGNEISFEFHDGIYGNNSRQFALFVLFSEATGKVIVFCQFICNVTRCYLRIKVQ